MKGRPQRSSSGKPLEYAGELYSEEHGRKFTTERAGVQVRERPHGRDEIGSCHRPKAHCRVVQGTVREVKAEHTATYTAAKEKQGYETVKLQFYTASK